MFEIEQMIYINVWNKAYLTPSLMYLPHLMNNWSLTYLKQVQLLDQEDLYKDLLLVPMDLSLLVIFLACFNNIC